MLYIIGVGLNEKGISLEGLEACKSSNIIYLESYTVDFPYKITELEKILGKKIIKLERPAVEGEEFVSEAKDKDITLLVYGAPLVATTHISVIVACKKQKIKYKILHSASIMDAVSGTGLQLYKFGKTASLPKWSDRDKPDSFVEVIRENESIGAHTLLLIDIGMTLEQAIEQLQEVSNKIKINNVFVCSRLGCKNSKILYDSIDKVKHKNIQKPFCIIIPGKLHFSEENFVEKEYNNP